ncbi:hypothetical protein NQ318_007412 [Aromia moschata]|uniref:Uncharacterized protein n=1 Tax=Aromia moschata TaxID=1265417 RepID=A0AAV8YMW4_9CUCU|nr:hypothetical protein NQ318_007412 [Aromia moschata]
MSKKSRKYMYVKRFLENQDEESDSQSVDCSLHLSNHTGVDTDINVLDNTSEYVPTSWAVDTKKDVYLWPKKLSETQIKKLRDNCSEPSLNIEYEEWDGICKATVFTLKHAQNLAEKAEYISNLSVDETDVEGLVMVLVTYQNKA